MEIHREQTNINTNTNTNTNIKHQSKQEEMQITKQLTIPSSSSSSSPAHEFSFAVSLQSSSQPNHNNSGPHQPPSAIDLTPADEIFFHGHLLPLHFFPNLPVSPRRSTNSLDGSTLMVDHKKTDTCICSGCDRTRGHSFNSYEYNNTRRIREHLSSTNDELPSKGRTKAKSFSLFGMARRRKEGEDQGEKEHKKKPRFDMTHFLKKYVKMFSMGRTTVDIQFRKQPYSFSGKRSPIDLRGLRGECSAPASMRTSPTNSGTISVKPRAPSPPSNDSTMEELQAAIQAAIAHCKDSIAAAEKLQA